MWMSVAMVGAAALARDVTREGRAASSPEAFFVYERAVECPVTVVVGPDGRPLDARADGCPDVVAPALREAALRWRWTRSAETSTESVRIPLRPPQFAARSVKGTCLVGFEVHGGQPRLLARIPGRCDLEIGPVAELISDTPERRMAWCAVDVAVDRAGARSVEVGACAEGAATHAATAVEGWTFPDQRPRRWRIVLGYALRTPHAS